MSIKNEESILVLVNNESYHTDGVGGDGKTRIGGASFIEVSGSNMSIRNNLSEIEGEITSILVRTDQDDVHNNYKHPELQNQERGSNEAGYTGSSLNITSYNLYEGDGSGQEKPSKLYIGIAGSAGNNDLLNQSKASQDWRQNYDVRLNRSKYNDLSVEKLKELANEVKTTKINPHGSDRPIEVHEVNPEHANLLYEIEIREKVEAMKKYRQDGIPIAIAGDSKGGEDAAYLGLKYVKEVKDVHAVELNLTNPKGVRVSDGDYKVLEEMAAAGKITIEIVYPEILSNGLIRDVGPNTDGTGIGDGRPIPCRPENKFYTVPVSVANPTNNHQIGNYEKNVYQGYDGKTKFQGNEKPKEIIQIINDKPVVLGYEYSINRIVKSDGTRISVSEYYFEEQKVHLNKILEHVNKEVLFLDNIIKEDYEGMFRESAKDNKSTLKEKHKSVIRNQTSEDKYVDDNLGNIFFTPAEEISAKKIKLRREYESKLTDHIDSESANYTGDVVSAASESIEKFREFSHDRMMELKLYTNHVTETLDKVKQAEQKYKDSQEEVKLVIKRMKNKGF